MMKAEVICDDCETKSTVEWEIFSELQKTKCPNCGNENIWFGDIENNGETFNLKGEGGCGKSG